MERRSQAPNPAAAVAALAARLEAAQPTPGSPEALFCRGVHRWLDEGGSLDQYLGLRSDGPGHEGAVALYRRSVRDRNLRAAHALCSGRTPWGRSVTLALEITRFSSVLWPRWRALDEPPEGCSEMRRHMFLAFKAGVPPESARGLHKVCVGL